jgi:hypothetical protein
MSRVPSNEPIRVPPGNSVYTVLAILAFVAGLIGLGVMFLRAGTLGVKLF